MRIFVQSCRARQHGAVLVVALVMLLVMTLLGIAATQNTTMEEKMAGNLRDQNLAFAAAEAALRAAETWVNGNCKADVTPAGCNTVLDSLGDPLTTAAYWTGAPTYDSILGGVANQPRYTIEFHSTVTDGYADDTGLDFYRITARGTGGSATTQVTLQTTFSLRK